MAASVDSRPVCARPGRRLASLAWGLCFFLALAAPRGRAQVLSDPTDPLYDDLEVWEVRGLTGPLPALQPYPLQFLRAVLQRVQGHPLATAAEERRAAWLLARLADELPHLAFDGELRTTSLTPGPYGLLALDPDWQFMPTPWLSLASHVRISGVRLEDGLLLPAARGNPEDFIADVTDIDVGDVRLDVRNMSYGTLAVGMVDDDGALFGQAGLSRHRLGPFYRNGIVVGQQAPVAGELSVMMQQSFFTAHIALFELQATDAVLGRRSGKHLHFHQLELHPAPWLDVGVFETVITGRLDPLYFLPASAYFHAQGIAGFADNSLVGLSGRVRPLPGLDVKGVFYADDFQFNDTVRGVLDTKYKFAAQLGAAWAPTSRHPAAPWWPALRLVAVDYTAVMPYMYTHINSTGEGFNVEDYTNGGVNFGPALEPNSDRVEVRSLLRLLDDPATSLVDLELRTAFLRHGNASAGIIEGRDGSILDDGYLGDQPTFQPPFEDPTGQPYTRFLTQRVIEQTLQASASLRWTFDSGRAVVLEERTSWERGFGSVTATVDATVEWADNAGLVAGVRRVEGFVGTSLSWRY